MEPNSFSNIYRLLCSSSFFDESSADDKLNRAGQLGQEVVKDLVGYNNGENRERLEVHFTIISTLLLCDKQNP